jgi:hypothetical protein
MLDIEGRPTLTTGQAIRYYGLARVAHVLPDGYVRFGPLRYDRPVCDMCGPFAHREQRWMPISREWRCRACDEE